MYLAVEGRSWAVDIAQLVERSPAQGLGFDPQYHRKWYGGACLYCQHSREIQGSEVQGHPPEQRVRNQPERHENLYDKNLYLCLTHTHSETERHKEMWGQGDEGEETDRQVNTCPKFNFSKSVIFSTVSWCHYQHFHNIDGQLLPPPSPPPSPGSAPSTCTVIIGPPFW